MKSIHIILVDDHRIFSAGLEQLLLSASDHFKATIDKIYGGLSLIQTYDLSRADLVILDIEMPDVNGLDVIKIIKNRNPNTRVLILSMHQDTYYSQEAQSEGADGYLTKSVESTELINHIVSILNGKKIFKHSATSRKPEKKILSRQEIKVLRILATGKTSTEIADMLNVSYLTIKAHRRNMMRKLNVNNSAELITVAVENGLL